MFCRSFVAHVYFVFHAVRVYKIYLQSVLVLFVYSLILLIQAIFIRPLLKKIDILNTGLLYMYLKFNIFGGNWFLNKFM